MVAERMYVNWETKATDDALGLIEGYGAVFGNVDRGGDVIEPGAFTETIADHMKAGTMPAMFFGHNPDDPIGEWTEMREDSRGLFLKGQLWVDDKGDRFADAQARKAFNMLKGRGMRGLSIGFRVMPDGAKMNGAVRELSRLELFEISPVSIPMNPEALPTSVKALAQDFTKRDVEKALRGLGMDSSQAKAFIADGWHGLNRDGDDTRDAADLDAMKQFYDAFTNQIKGS